MRRLYLVILIILTVKNIAFSQYLEKKVKPQCRYNYFQITVGGGFTRPVLEMSNHYNPSAVMGAELAYRVNPEVAVFFEEKYNLMSLIDTAGPSTSFLETSIGTRFYWTSKYVRSTFYIEFAIGPNIKFQGSYVNTANNNVESLTDFKLGANAGFGAELVFTDNIYFTVKAKYHSIFGVGGIITYVDGFAGMTFRL